MRIRTSDGAPGYPVPGRCKRSGEHLSSFPVNAILTVRILLPDVPTVKIPFLQAQGDRDELSRKKRTALRTILSDNVLCARSD